MKKRVYIDRAGCNRRLLELERIKTYLGLNEYVIVPRPGMADMILVATCAFKKKEEDDSSARLEELSQYAAETVVFGCLPDIAPKRYEKFRHLPKVAPKELEQIESYFAGSQLPFSAVSESHVLNTGKNQVNFKSLWRNLKNARFQSSADISDLFHKMLVEGRVKLTSGRKGIPDQYYLMVSRGCLGRCSYCAIKKSIGAVKSIPLSILQADMVEGLRLGFRDFVIVGDDPGCYGVDIGSSLPELLKVLTNVRKALAETVDDADKDICFHIKEIHPKFLIELDLKLSETQCLEKIKSILCPIQSGSDRILGLMQREHSIGRLLNTLTGIKARYADLALSTQIIIGFPTETEDDFQQTLAAVKNGGFSSVVVFPYDDKEGTASSQLDGKVPHAITRKRVRRAFKYFRSNRVQATYSCPP